jgi:hypothetical protein
VADNCLSLTGSLEATTTCTGWRWELSTSEWGVGRGGGGQDRKREALKPGKPGKQEAPRNQPCSLPQGQKWHRWQRQFALRGEGWCVFGVGVRGGVGARSKAGYVHQKQD